MRYAHACTVALLMFIATLLAGNIALRFRFTTVHAESAQYGVEVITAKLPLPMSKWGSMPYPSELAAGINQAAKGRELVTVLWLNPSDKYVAVFKEAKPK